MHTPDFSLTLSTASDAHAIKNLWPLYLHDISEFDRRVPNAHGVIGDTDQPTRWGGPGEAWWKNPEALFPYIVRVGDSVAGFNLIAGGPYVPDEAIDYTVHEFFIVQAFRGTDVAQRAAQEGIEKHRGRWEVLTYPNGPRQVAFWRKTLATCATSEVDERVKQLELGQKTVFRFSNA